VIVYIWGSLTRENFTPRLGKDTVGRPGQKPGLSASRSIPPGRKAQGIDLDRLRPPLRAFPDEVDLGGSSGHIAIAPADEVGEVDTTMLEIWALTRDTGQAHELTQILLNAVVQPNAKGNL
jgi:hypothetical protein